MSLKEIRMSIEQTKTLDGTICHYLVNQLKDEFDRQDYLLERYSRSKSLEEIRKTDDVTKMDIICAYEKYITDVAVGYVMGKRLTYYNKEKKEVKKRKTIFGAEKEYTMQKSFSNKDSVQENDDFLNELEELREFNREHKENIKLTRNAFITSKAYELVYTNEYGDIRYKMLNGHCSLIKSNDVESKVIGFLRTYKTNNLKIEHETVSNEQITVIELYTHFKRVYYTSEDNYKTEHSLLKDGTKPFLEEWEIPIVSVEMPFNIGLFEQQVSEIRGYELVTNNTKKILNYNDDAILMISGVMFMNGESEEEINKVIERYRTSGVIFTGSPEDGGGATWLTKQVNDGTNQSHKQNLKNDIYGVAGLFNPENDSAVYQNTLSLVFKLYGLETKMSEFEETFKEAIKRRNQIISQILNYRDGRSYNFRNIDVTMFRNLPTNTNEELNFANQTREILPLEKIYEELSFVNDAKQMVKLYEEDQIRQAKLEAKIAEIMAESTQKDMQSDNPNLNSNNDNTNDNKDEDEDEESKDGKDSKNSEDGEDDKKEDSKDDKNSKNDKKVDDSKDE
jgi:SPP1 family phage portal protein